MPVLALSLTMASCGKKTNPALLGEWENRNGSKSVYLTFEKGGELAMSGDTGSLGPLLPSFSMITDFGMQPGKNTITYKCTSATQMEVEGDLSVLLDKLSAGGTGKASPEMLQKLHPKETLTFVVNGKDLTLTNDKGQSLKLKRLE